MASQTTTSTQTVLRHVGLDDLDAIAECFNESFKGDPAYDYFVNCDGNTPEQQHAAGFGMFKYVASAALLQGGEIHAIVDPSNPEVLLACAIWLRPGASMKDSWYMWFRSGMWRYSYILGKESKHNFLEDYMGKSTGVKYDITKKYGHGRDFWYLNFLGTIPSARGKGYSRTLIKYITDQADATKHNCYVESSTAENAGFVYEKHGFITRGILSVNNGKLNKPCMLREPK